MFFNKFARCSIPYFNTFSFFWGWPSFGLKQLAASMLSQVLRSLAGQDYTLYWPQIRLMCAKRKRERVKFVAPPKEILHLFSCVRFLTNYDVRKRKQHIGVTISCELKTNF